MVNTNTSRDFKGIYEESDKKGYEIKLILELDKISLVQNYIRFRITHKNYPKIRVDIGI